MADYDIRVDLPYRIEADAPLPAVFPTLAEAVLQMAQFAQQQWIAYATGAPLPDGRMIPSWTGGNGEYARSITLIQRDALEYRVESNYVTADQIESGFPAYDMKNALRTSLKVRINKKGGRYLIIPFRHGTPGTVGFSSVMPVHVHEVARGLAASRVTGSRSVPNVIGVHDLNTRALIDVTRHSYKWGGKLGTSGASKLRPHHKTDPFSGLYRFDAPEGGHSQFLTFRTMTEGSKGWIRGAQPGYWPAMEVSRQVERAAPAIFQAALERDVANYIAGLGLSP